MSRKVMNLSLLLAALMPALALGQQQQSRPMAPFALTRDVYILDTADPGQKLRVSVLVRGLKSPWSIAFLPSGDALISERGGQLRYVRNVIGPTDAKPVLDAEPVAGLPSLQAARQKGGLHEVILHPKFAQNQLVYLTFNQAGQPDAGEGAKEEILLTVLRGQLSGRALTNVTSIYSKAAPSPSGSRLAFGQDDKLYVATGDNFYDPEPQQLDNASGKILRLNEDGTVPKDNPFVEREGAWPEVYSYGHSAQYGLAIHPDTGAVLSTENGPIGGDELNLILPGRNYGWPLVSFGRRESGARLSESPVAPGVEQPLAVWLPGVTPSGMAFYTGDKFANWKGDLFVGYVRRGRTSFTGGIERMHFNDKLEELQRESLLTELRQRIRDVRQGPDGLLYALTDGDGVLLRIESAADELKP